MHVYILPNLLTTGNLFCGFYSLLEIFQGRFLFGAYAILGATVFDFLFKFDSRGNVFALNKSNQVRNIVFAGKSFK